ncbi:MAG: Mrp/NBP35 family ATP-binding protein [Hyphomonadaceae bacterium]|nr:Mrp/NBP35 family ATP-binding protein [Hyphomonadaceae bacterium]
MNTSLQAQRDIISRALDAIKDPLSGKGLIAAGRVENLLVSADGGVLFAIEAPAGEGPRFAPVRAAAEAAVRAVPGVSKVTAVLTAPAEGRADAPRKPSQKPPQTPAQSPPLGAPRGIAHVAMLVAVASAKGGVGKSTVAANLAAAFQGLGLRTGLLDLDVYGPSLPTLLGVAGQKPTIGPDKLLRPLMAHGLATMSIGYIVDPEQAIIWRGAMATTAVRQLIDEVAWGTAEAPLDILVLDLPPGTGDVQLTLAQRLPLDGAVIVSTPQEMALADVRRGIAMFEKTHIPVLGVIENMAWLETGGERLHVFGDGGARRTALEAGVPFLGELPIEVGLRESADAGLPFALAHPDHPLTARFRAIAAATLENARTAARPAPVIRFE